MKHSSTPPLGTPDAPPRPKLEPISGHLRMWAIEQVIKNSGAYAGGPPASTIVEQAEVLIKYVDNGDVPKHETEPLPKFFIGHYHDKFYLLPYDEKQKWLRHVTAPLDHQSAQDRSYFLQNLFADYIYTEPISNINFTPC
jgi:hypothetical protein